LSNQQLLSYASLSLAGGADKHLFLGTTLLCPTSKLPSSFFFVNFLPNSSNDSSLSRILLCLGVEKIESDEEDGWTLALLRRGRRGRAMTWLFMDESEAGSRFLFTA
jgi:hypothetical protein